jgi:hypothetical protein
MPRATEVGFVGLGLTWEEHCTHNLESSVVGEKCTEDIVLWLDLAFAAKFIRLVTSYRIAIHVPSVQSFRVEVSF